MVSLSSLSNPRDVEILKHYSKFLGQPADVIQFDFQDLVQGSLFVIEFAPSSDEFDWIYVTIGMSRKPQTNDESLHRVELLMYAKERSPQLAATLFELARYPFVNHSRIAAGHTIAGRPGIGVVEGSPLTEILFTPIYFEADGFDTLLLQDGTHIQVLWATPIHLSEREFILQFGWRTLVEDVFPDREVQPADLWRAPAV